MDTVKIEGVDKVVRALAHDAAKRMEHPNQATGHSVIVGYTANYASYVHENMEMRWKDVERDPRKRAPGSLGGPKKYHLKKPRKRAYNPKGKFWETGQPKFLEQSARDLNNDGTLGNVLVRAARRGVKLQQAIYLAALQIQGKSQKMVPVDTGNLKSSAFTRKE